MDNFKIISNFKEVPLIKNTLYILDIDETTLYYEGMNYKWWEKTMIEMIKIYDTFEEAEYETHDLWYKVINNIEPVITDNEGFFKLKNFVETKTNGCKMIFLTARPIKYKDITLKDLKNNIEKFNYPVVFFDSYPDNKGIILQKFLKENKETYDKINNKIFIDDLEKNIKNVLEVYPETKCFQFKHPEFYKDSQHF